MIYSYAFFGYIIVNCLLCFIVMKKSGGNVIGKFFTFCVASVTAFGISVYILETNLFPALDNVTQIIVDFLFSLIPFFFLHFIVVFLRRYELLKSKWVIIAVYFAGLFSFSIVRSGLLPDPVVKDDGSASIANIYFVTWMSVFFSIGLAILFSHIRVFAERKTKSSILFTGLSILVLVLPSPFTYSLSVSFFQNQTEWYGITSILALIVSVYLVFRHKILVTLYDSVKAALLVMDDVFIMTDAHFTIEVARGSATPMLGYTEKEMIGRNLNDFLLEKEYIISYLEYVAKGKMKECRFDSEVIGKTGEPVTINFSFSPVVENEQIAGFVGIGRDITKRKLAEIELRESREQYRELVENIREAFYVADKDGKVMYVSPNVTLFTGFKPEELLHTSYVRFIDSRDRRRVIDFYRARAADGTIDTSCELRVRRKDGKTLWVEQTTRIIRDEKGSATEYRNIVHDVTERKKTDEQIHLLAKALETTSEPIWISDQQNRIIHVNKAFEKTFGYAKEEIFHSHPIILFSPKQQDIVLAEIISKRENYGWNGEILCCKKDLTEFPAFLSASVMKGEGGDIIGYIGVARDISEYKTMEERLRQSQKLEGIGTLAGGVAHDFNNILTIILSYNTILSRSGYDSERYTEAVKMIRNAVERGAGIVRQLLTIARKNPVEFSSVKINETVTEMVQLIKETFPKLITVNIDLDPSVPETIADQTQIQQILLNLCVNARDAMPQGGVLTIQTRLVSGDSLSDRFREVNDTHYVHISVSDTGTGIEESAKQKIFEPFYTTKGEGKGTGLGLAVVYGVVRSHHGFIDLKSEVGKGSTFHVFLPVIADPNHSQSNNTLLAQNTLGGKETILLVEDEEALLSFLRRELESMGYHVLEAHDGVEAINIFKSNKDNISVVVSDLGLPKLGGWESYLKMKEIKPDVRVLLASGYFDTQLQSSMTTAGVNGCLSKPYDIKDLLTKLRSTIDKPYNKN